MYDIYIYMQDDNGVYVVSYLCQLCTLRNGSQCHGSTWRSLLGGLSRAGICDFQHQKRIEKELLSLEESVGSDMMGQRLLQSSSEPVLKAQKSLQLHVRKPGPPIRPQRNALLVCRGDAKIRCEMEGRKLLKKPFE